MELLEEYDSNDIPIVNRDISKPVFEKISEDCIIPCPSRRLLAWELRRPNIGNFFCTDDMLPGEHIKATQEKIIQDIRGSLGERCSDIVKSFLASLSESELRDLYENINAELTTANGRIVQHSQVILTTTCCNHLNISKLSTAVKFVHHF